MACPNFEDKTFAGGPKATKFVHVSFLESFPLYGIDYPQNRTSWNFPPLLEDASLKAVMQPSKTHWTCKFQGAKDSLALNECEGNMAGEYLAEWVRRTAVNRLCLPVLVYTDQHLELGAIKSIYSACQLYTIETYVSTMQWRETTHYSL